jgi:hypothetical protein
MSRLVIICVVLAACTSSSPSPIATGEVDAWEAGPDLPVARANHCAVAIGDWVLVVGGNRAMGSGFASTDEIDAAQIQADGSLGAWQVAGHLASAANEPTCTSDGKTLYVIGGIYDRETDGGQIWTAVLDDSGHLGAMTSWGALPEGVAAVASGAHVVNGTLILTHSSVPMENMPDTDKTVTLRTPIAGGPVWTTDDWGVDFHALYETAFTNNAVYLLGGYHDPAVGVLTDTYVAHLGAGGAVTSIVPTTPLPTPVAFGSAVAVDNWLFVAGGRAQVFGAPGTTKVYAAPIAGDGSLGEWNETTALPMARTNTVMVVVGDYLVMAGGANNGPGDAKVLVARVRYAR